MPIIENINRYCGEHGISIKRFERECKMANATVQKWKKGINKPSIRTLEKMSKFTGIPIEEWLKE